VSSIANYREIDPAEAGIVAAEHADAWKDPSIPKLQRVIAGAELGRYRSGISVPPFNALIRCLRQVTLGPKVSFLDVGASSGYYSEVLQIAGYDFDYTAIDFSPTFKAFAEELYPGIRFDLGDARQLPYKDNSFDIVLSGCCLLHILDYGEVIRETARVCSRYAIFSKTPITFDKTRYFEKTAYGVPCLEIHFSEAELMQLFDDAGLRVIYSTDVYPIETSGGYRTYLLEKTITHHPV
jgi:SAM-dependent methyltransferase